MRTKCSRRWRGAPRPVSRSASAPPVHTGSVPWVGPAPSGPWSPASASGTHRPQRPWARTCTRTARAGTPPRQRRPIRSKRRPGRSVPVRCRAAAAAARLLAAGATARANSATWGLAATPGAVEASAASARPRAAEGRRIAIPNTVPNPRLRPGKAFAPRSVGRRDDLRALVDPLRAEVADRVEDLVVEGLAADQVAPRGGRDGVGHVRVVLEQQRLVARLAVELLAHDRLEL